jgi:hypothetical protein
MKKALYFIPDISGFTQFVDENELEHSIHIISELLEILIDSNTIGLKLVEIEGDALFFYADTVPDFETLVNQVYLMAESFHQHTQSYEKLRICSCGSCRTTVELKLKFIIHFGDLVFLTVKKIRKPYGTAVIKIHRLLKNSVPSHEYILLSNEAAQLYRFNLDLSWTQGEDNFDLGTLLYHFKDLSFIKHKTTNSLHHLPENKGFYPSKPAFIMERKMEVEMQVLYRYISELKNRKFWDNTIDKIFFYDQRVNRVGTEHNCILKLGSLKFETIGSRLSDGLIYGEKTKSMLFTRSYSYQIRLSPTIDSYKSTFMMVEVFIEFSYWGSFLKKTMRKYLQVMWKKKLELLQSLISRNNYC